MTTKPKSILILNLVLIILLLSHSGWPKAIKQDAREDWKKTADTIQEKDIEIYLKRLASSAMEGRATGTSGEQRATEYVAELFRLLHLTPAGDKGSYFQSFEFTAGVSLGSKNSCEAVTENQKRRKLALNKEWRPLAFSGAGATAKAGVVFAGYGLSIPAADNQDAYDSYQGLDVKDKWVLVFRYIPENVGNERRQHLQRFAGLAYKVAAARNHGARGIVVVSGPNSKVKEQLVKLQFEGSVAGSSMGALSIVDSVADEWLRTEGKDLKSLQDALDEGKTVPSFLLGKMTLETSIDIKKIKRLGRNVVARLGAGTQSVPGMIVLGAHIDHLGKGEGSNSLARAEEKGQIHFGADDNASGVAGLLEIAQYFASRKTAQASMLKRDLLFTVWSGEELGLLGSGYFAQHFGGDAERKQLALDLAAYLNLDMIGRFDQKLILQGIGSSSLWKTLVENKNADLKIPLTLQNDSYLPTDATSFYMKGVPILSAFTGAHSDYHTPRDTVDRINLKGMGQITRLFAGIMENLSASAQVPDYQEMKKPENVRARAGVRVYLGTIPDFSKADAIGVALAGASKGSPAEKAGIQKGDIVIELAGKKIENIYDYTFAMGLLKVGEATTMVVQRGNDKVKLTIIPGARD